MKKHPIVVRFLTPIWLHKSVMTLNGEIFKLIPSGIGAASLFPPEDELIINLNTVIFTANTHSLPKLWFSLTRGHLKSSSNFFGFWVYLKYREKSRSEIFKNLTLRSGGYLKMGVLWMKYNSKTNFIDTLIMWTK